MSELETTQSERREPRSTGRMVFATLLDLLCAFFLGGYAVGYATGNLTNEGFNLTGGPALILLAGIALYFVVFVKFLGGTIWQRVLGVR